MPPTETRKRTRAAGSASKRRKPDSSSARRPRSGSGRKATRRVTTDDFVAHLIKAFGLSKADARAIYLEVMSFLRDSLTGNKRVIIPRVGRLEPYWKPTQNYVHPKTGELTKTGRRKLVRLILSQRLKEDL